jgi:uncharacterized protein (TIGR02145 family)
MAANAQESVIIEGVEWATVNVGDSGVFVSSNAEMGGYYTFQEAQTVCPCGWRLPIKAEFEMIEKREFRSLSKINGVIYKKFGRDGNYLYLPLAGYKMNDNLLKNKNVFGYYWINDNFIPYYLSVGKTRGSWIFSDSSSYKQSVRCVKDQKRR